MGYWSYYLSSIRGRCAGLTDGVCCEILWLLGGGKKEERKGTMKKLLRIEGRLPMEAESCRAAILSALWGLEGADVTVGEDPPSHPADVFVDVTVDVKKPSDECILGVARALASAYGLETWEEDHAGN